MKKKKKVCRRQQRGEKLEITLFWIFGRLAMKKPAKWPYLTYPHAKPIWGLTVTPLPNSLFPNTVYGVCKYCLRGSWGRYQGDSIAITKLAYTRLYVTNCTRRKDSPLREDGLPMSTLRTVYQTTDPGLSIQPSGGFAPRTMGAARRGLMKNARSSLVSSLARRGRDSLHPRQVRFES